MPFIPGRSGNPSGRPRGFAGVAARILSETRNGDELVEYALGVMRDGKAKPTDRLAAHAWLADRALGKPLQSIDAVLSRGDDVDDERAFDHLSLERRRELLAELEGPA